MAAKHVKFEETATRTQYRNGLGQKAQNGIGLRAAQPT